MNVDEYQERTEETAVYPEQQAVPYLALGLNDESGDVLWYWVRLLDELDLDASEVMEANADKVFDRKERGVIQGDGDKR